MAFDRDSIYEKAKAVARGKNLFFVQDVVGFLPCTRRTFYRYFPDGSDELESIHEILYDNRIQTKSNIRRKLYDSNRASELLALYKLIATPEERAALSMQHFDHTSGGEKMDIKIVIPESATKSDPIE